MKVLPFTIDEYDLRARLYPGVLISLPLCAGVFALWPALRKPTGLGAGAILEAALLFWLMRIARDQGKRVEPKLFARWGGRPTTLLLRWSNAEIDPVTKQRYHRVLAGFIDKPLPDRETELGNGSAADSLYESAVRCLIEKRRTKRFRLVFTENCNYGFARNLYGLRSAGFAAYSGMAAMLIWLAWRAAGHLTDLEWGLALLNVLCLTLLLNYSSEGSVKRAAFAYAIALLRSCESAASLSRPKVPCRKKA